MRSTVLTIVGPGTHRGTPEDGQGAKPVDRGFHDITGQSANTLPNMTRLSGRSPAKGD